MDTYTEDMQYIFKYYNISNTLYLIPAKQCGGWEYCIGVSGWVHSDGEAVCIINPEYHSESLSNNEDLLTAMRDSLSGDYQRYINVSYSFRFGRC